MNISTFIFATHVIVPDHFTMGFCCTGNNTTSNILHHYGRVLTFDWFTNSYIMVVYQNVLVWTNNSDSTLKKFP